MPGINKARRIGGTTNCLTRRVKLATGFGDRCRGATDNGLVDGSGGIFSVAVAVDRDCDRFWC